MNNTFKVNTLKVLVITLGTLVALQSAELTYLFLNDMSVQLGRVGLIAEAFKFVLPLVALSAYRNGKKLVGLALSTVIILLCTLSFVASYAAVETGLQSESKQTQMYLALEEQILSLKELADSKREIALSYSVNKYKTKRNSYLSEAGALDAQVMDLRKQQADLPAENTMAQYIPQVSLGVALILELLGVCTSLALSVVAPHRAVKTSAEPVREPSTDKDSEVQEVIPDNAVDFAVKKRNSDIKTAIMSGDVRPSQRGVMERFKVGRETVNEVLSELAEEGKVESYRGGWRLVA